jgi:hypothetical protein
MGARLAWLGLTPEPERELPVAIAMLRARTAGIGTRDDLGPWIDAEARRIERLIMRGTGRTWLRYLTEVTALIAAAYPPRSQEDPDRTTSVKSRPWGRTDRASSRKLRPWGRFKAASSRKSPTWEAADRATSRKSQPRDDAEFSGYAHEATLVRRAAEAVLDHHRMLIGLPGGAYERVAADRRVLTEIVAGLRTVRP